MTKNIKQLEDLDWLSKAQVAALNPVVEQFSFAMTKQLLNQMEGRDSDPIAQQFVPSEQELTFTPEEVSDPIGDGLKEPVKGIVHRYRDRCLLMPVKVCPVYCRFCFRREKVGPGNAALSRAELESALDYIASHKDIWEVILSGGDPLILKPKSLQKILDRLADIDHVEAIRIHTRVPVVDSERINNEMLAVLSESKKPIFIAIHANHAQEFGEEATEAVSRLVKAGIPLISQSVLLKGVNDNVETLGELMRCFVRHRIKPYYIHHPDLAKGTSHFRLSIEEGQALMAELKRTYSGICQPTYVIDSPDASGKVKLA